MTKTNPKALKTAATNAAALEEVYVTLRQLHEMLSWIVKNKEEALGKPALEIFKRAFVGQVPDADYQKIMNSEYDAHLQKRIEQLIAFENGTADPTEHILKEASYERAWVEFATVALRACPQIYGDTTWSELTRADFDFWPASAIYGALAISLEVGSTASGAVRFLLEKIAGRTKDPDYTPEKVLKLRTRLYDATKASDDAIAADDSLDRIDQAWMAPS